MGDVATTRLLHVSRWLGAKGGGGVSTYIEAVDCALKNCGVEGRRAGLLPEDMSPYFTGRLAKSRIRVLKLLGAMRLAKSMLLEREKTDCVHIHGVTDWHFLVASTLCRTAGMPYFVSTHGGVSPAAMHAQGMRRMLWWIYIRLIMVPGLKHSSAIVATTETERQLIDGLVPGSDIRVIAPGLPGLSETRSSISGKSTPVDTMRLVFVGRIEPIKSVPTLIQALYQLRSRGVNAHLDLAGEGSPEYVSYIASLIAELQLESYVKWCGYVDGPEKCLLFRSASALVLPSLSENFGFVVAEAMAEGCPVFVSEGVGLACLVKTLECGEVFPIGDEATLVEALLRYTHPLVWQKASYNAYIGALQYFSLEAMRKQLLTLYTTRRL